MKHLNELCTDVETWDEARFLAELDYELHLGAVFTVNTYTTYVADDSVDHCDVVRVRLEKTPTSDLIHHQIDEYLDPYWDIDVLSAHEGSGAYTFGPSYRVLEAVRENRRLVA